MYQLELPFAVLLVEQLERLIEYQYKYQGKLGFVDPGVIIAETDYVFVTFSYSIWQWGRVPEQLHLPFPEAFYAPADLALR